MSIEKIAAAAANWWADRLTFGASALGDAGLSMLATCFTVGQSPEQALAQKFQDTLMRRILENLRAYRTTNLSHDYQPSGLLQQVANEVGISTAGFPQKTSMTVTRKGIMCSQGYAGQPVKLPIAA